MKRPDAGKAGQFKVGGKITVNRLGFGAMRLTGAGIWGKPEDRAICLRTLKQLPELGVNLIDTADSYGPDVSEHMVHAGLHPYENMLIATKGGLVRTGPDAWHAVGRPEYLRQQALMSARFLHVPSIGLWQLHRIDPKVPRDEQFGAIKSMLEDGLILQAGLSNVTVAEIEAARAVFAVATVQNRYNLTDRGSEAVLDYCTANGIGFIPWYPLAAGKLAKPGGPLDKVATAHKATPGQVALAWLLRRSPVMLPIPGTANPAHAAENVAAAHLTLTDAEFDSLDQATRTVERVAA